MGPLALLGGQSPYSNAVPSLHLVFVHLLSHTHDWCSCSASVTPVCNTLTLTFICIHICMLMITPRLATFAQVHSHAHIWCLCSTSASPIPFIHSLTFSCTHLMFTLRFIHVEHGLAHLTWHITLPLNARLITIPPVRVQAADRRTGRSEFKFRGRALSQHHVMWFPYRIWP